MAEQIALNVAQLTTDGRRYEGWQAVHVRRGIEQCAGGFELQVSELWPGQDYTRRIDPGAACVVALGGTPVLTGYVDAATMQIDGTRHLVRVMGRDKTADLVDCSAVRSPGQWRGQRIERIAQDLAEPFGIVVRTEVDTGKPLTSFALQEGETVFEAIERAARIRALLLMTDGSGALVLTRAGGTRAPTTLKLGQNILRARAGLDLRDRFSQYIAKGQASGNDFVSGAQVAQMRALASDPGVPRYRPLVVTADTPDAAVGLQQRARWEATVRAARSTRVLLEVQGWRHLGDQGGLWEPNTLVRVEAEPLRLEGDMLIAAVEYSQGEEGTLCTLELTRPDAFSQLAIAAPSAQDPSSWFNMPKAAAG